MQIPSGLACDQYHRFEADLDLAKSLGHTAYRFSLEWSRIEPEPGRYSDEALEHYSKVIQACRQRNLEPVVTIHHFTIPQWLAVQGGWSSSKSVSAFSRWVERIADRLGSRVRWWVTINEPTVLVYKGYLTGEWPPGRRGDGFRGLQVLRHLMQAHRAAYSILHREAARRNDPRPMVGLAHHIVWYTPCNPRSRTDRLATRIRHFVGNRLLLRACQGTMDFIGLNYYMRDFIHWAGWGPISLLGAICSAGHHSDAGPRNDMGWEIYPEGLRKTLLELKEFGLPILITENGVCTGQDSVRQRFIEEHLHEMEAAMEQGVSLVGYLYWSLIDNFEWAEGFSPRFGLVEVDYTTLERRVRPSALKFAERIRSRYHR